MKSRRHDMLRAVVVTVLVFVLIFAGAVFLMDYVGNVSEDAQTEMVRSAVRNAALTCYAVEGAYPSEIEYLVENYGLAYDSERFLITYEAFASNIFPDIYVNVRGGE